MNEYFCSSSNSIRCTQASAILKALPWSVFPFSLFSLIPFTNRYLRTVSSYSEYFSAPPYSYSWTNEWLVLLSLPTRSFPSTCIHIAVSWRVSFPLTSAQCPYSLVFHTRLSSFITKTFFEHYGLAQRNTGMGLGAYVPGKGSSTSKGAEAWQHLNHLRTFEQIFIIIPLALYLFTCLSLALNSKFLEVGSLFYLYLYPQSTAR